MIDWMDSQEREKKIIFLGKLIKYQQSEEL